MSVPIIIEDKMKSECVEESSVLKCDTLIQSYLDTFNKEIEGNDVIVQMAEMEQVEEEIGEEECTEGAYFVDQQGHYYYQATADPQPVITTIGEGVIQENEITLPEDVSGQIIGTNGESFQTVTIMPSETMNGEVCYVLIVQQPDGKSQEHEDKILPDGDTNMTVYDFDENEELEEPQEFDSGAEDDKSKIIRIPMKKPQTITTQHMCNYCNYISPKRYLLSRHMKSHSEERPHKCSVCERGFKTLASLQNHVNTHTGTKPHKCRSCESAFTTSGELVRHVRYRHTHERPHKCHECDYASVELSKLKRHVRCHTGERPYQCQHCTYASPDTFKLKRHLRTHTGEKPYECDTCHMCFTQSNSLKAHKLTHNVGEKPIFPCQLCPTTCGRKTDLRIHVQKLHTSEKPLKCKRCGKSFPDRYSYKLHNKTHEGEKCFKCEMCPYASVSMRHLNSHMLIHTDEKPFACEQCDQTFRQKQLLKRHQNLYHNPEYIPPSPKEKSHECVECRRQFRHKGNLIRHLAVHDPESAIHEKSLALKLGRQKKIHIIDGQSVEVMQNGLDLGDEEMDADSGTVMSSNDMQQYVVLEVIELTGEGGDEQMAVVSDNYGEENFISGDLDESSSESSLRSKKPDMAQIKHIASEKDMENCFGFDDEDVEDVSEDEDHQLESLKLIPID